MNVGQSPAAGSAVHRYAGKAMPVASCEAVRVTTRSRGRPRAVLRRARQAVLVLAVALTAAGAALATWGGGQYDVGPLRTELSLVPALSGGVAVEVPPLGRLQLPTHVGPLTVTATVNGVDPARARAVLEGSQPGRATTRQIAADAKDSVTSAALRGVLVALLAAAVSCAAVFRRPKPVIAGTGVVLLAFAASGTAAWITFRPEAIQQPRFEGLLAQAPALIGRVQDFDAYSDRIAALTSNVASVYERLPSLPIDTETGSTRILWVSDIHNNPAAFTVMRQLVRQFDVAAVVDSGDIVDLGSTVENPPLRSINSLGVPYLYVRGNHDSYRVTQQFIANQPQGRVLDDGAVVEIAGVRFTGTGDPLFRPSRTPTGESQANDRLLKEAGQALRVVIEAQPEPVDVALVHNPLPAEQLAGAVPLVLSGHAHERRHRVADGTLALTQGSSGGAGLRTLDRGDPLPLQMSVLHFDHGGALTAVDEVTVGGLGERSVTLQRRTPQSYGQEEPVS
jgi:predicted phosphodiesterase